MNARSRRDVPARRVLRPLIVLGAVVLLSVPGAARCDEPAPGATGHELMLELLEQIAERTLEDHPFLGDRKARRLREELGALPESAPIGTRWQLSMESAKAELILGNETEAIRRYTAALQMIDGSELEAKPEVTNWTRFRLGVAYMRLGETQNCCLRRTPESCILPLKDGAIHVQQDPSRKALEQFTAVLRATGPAEPLHLAARWLLNVAYMTVGTYPGKVPEAYLLPPGSFESEEQIPRFRNIAQAEQLDIFDLSGGAIADDFDNDGYLDLVVSTWDTRGPMHFFRNNRDGTFPERTEAAGLKGFFGGLNMVQADYDNDGDVDILVLRGAWLERAGRHPNSLLRNDGHGRFTDVTFDAGLGGAHYPTQTASWGDYDGDGDLDLYIGNETTKALKDAPCQLFRNEGDGTFVDVAAGAGVQNFRFSKAVIWGDYDGDRRPDLFVSNLGGENRLYRNNGDGTFTNVARSLKVAGLIYSFPAWLWDFNNDGALDIFVSAYSAGIPDLAASLLGMPVNPSRLPHLYRADGRGGFSQVAQESNLARPNAPMGSNFGDLDNDGYLDFYLGTGYPSLKDLMPNVMFRNRAGTSFVDVSNAGGFAHLQKGHAVVFADLDNDGDQDVFEQMGGAYPGDGFSNALYENPGFGNHWIGIKLVGVRSNRSAIGARIRAQVIENGVARSIYKHVNSGGSFGANPLRQTLGLGAASTIKVLEVFWPATDLTQTFRDVPADRFIRIVEGEPEYSPLDLERLTFRRPGDDE